MDGVRIVKLIILLIFLAVIYYLLRLYRATRMEKRIAPFAIQNKKSTEKSLFDNLNSILWIIIKKMSYWFHKSHFLTKYGEKYNKYIVYEERDIKDGIDYVSIKFLMAFSVLVLSLLSLVFQKVEIDFMILLIIFLIAFYFLDIFLKISYELKRKRIEDDLLKAIIIMNNAFNSGRNIIQAIEIVKDELDGPIQDEFKKIYLDITYGLSLDVVFNRFYERVKLEDAKYITTSLSLLNKTGGDIVKVFSIIEKSIFDKKNLKNELHSLTASSRFVFKMLVFLPFIFVTLIFILNPTYFMPFFTEPLGIIILIFIVLLYILYILVIRRVLEVEI